MKVTCPYCLMEWPTEEDWMNDYENCGEECLRKHIKADAEFDRLESKVNEWLDKL